MQARPMTKRFCDRCEQEIGGESCNFNLAKTKKGLGTAVFTVDLCYSCDKSLSKWFDAK